MLEEAGVVIVGAGAFGCAAAYHLARRGVQGIVVLDRRGIATQTTPRAAGLTAVLRPTDLMTAIARESAEFFARFETEVGQPLGFQKVGSIKVALTEAREAQLKEDIQRAKSLGLEVVWLSPAEVARLLPVFEAKGVRAATFSAADGYIPEPGLVPLGLARKAEELGARFETNVAVSGVLVKDGTVRGVTTERGEIRAPTVIDTAGAWASLVAGSVGVHLATVPIRHQLYITTPIQGLSPTQPVLRIHDASVYTRYAKGGLMVGGYESDPRSFDLTTLPTPFEIKDLPLDFSVLSRLTDGVRDFFPVLRRAAIQEHRGGLPTITPDGQHLIGPIPGIRGFFVATGCNVAGLSVSPTIGRLLAEWVIEGRPSLDLSPLAPTRFGEEYRSIARLRLACEDVYRHQYSVEGGRI